MLFFRGRTTKRNSSIQSNHDEAPAATTARIARACMEVLEERKLLANPVLDPIPDARVPGGKSLIIPLTASDEDGDRLTYTVSSDNDDIDVRMSKSTTWVRMTVQTTATTPQNISGEMVFQLFGDFAPETVRSFVNLVKAEFYNNLKFHRLANLGPTDSPRSSWILQGGDPQGTGSGPSQFRLDDEYHRDGIFSGKGQLAMAKSTDDSGGTQFFIAQSPTRHLDYDHTIFGQMVRGFGVLEEITEKLRPATNATAPSQELKIGVAEIVKNKTDGVLIIRAPRGEDGTVRVRVSDGTTTDSQTFDVRAPSDSTDGTANNAEPYLVSPLKDRIIAATQFFDVKLSAFDLEGDTKVFAAQAVNTGNSLHALVANDLLRIVPDPGFRGPLVYDIWTYRTGGATDKAQSADSQRVVFMIGEDEISNVEAVTFDGEVGANKQDTLLTFRDTNPNGQAGDFAAQINWGDGTVTANATITEDNGVFRVRGSHSYAVAGKYKVVVTIESNLNATAATSAGGRRGILRKVVTNAIVADGALTGVEKVIIGDAGVALSSVVVAEFKSADARDVATDFDVEIKWGDGTVHHSDNTADNVGRTSLGGGSFRITGTKAGGYATADAYAVTVTVTDRESGKSVVIDSEAFIDRAGFDIGTVTDTGSLDEGVADNFQDDDVTITDSETGHTYTGKINWGEGDADDFEDLVVDSAAKTFDLKHTYKESGTYEILIIITDEDGNTATKRQSITVVNKPPTISPIVGPTTAVRGEKITIKLRDVADLSEEDSKNVFRYEIDWGDGTAKQTLSDFDKDNRLTTATHIYKNVSFTTDTTAADTFTIKVRAMDADMTSSLAENERTLVIDVKAIELRDDPDDSSIKHLYVGGIAQASGNDNLTERITVAPHTDGTAGKVTVTIDNEGTANDVTDTQTIPAGGRIIVFGGGDGASDGNGNDIIRIEEGITNDAELYGGTGNDKLVGAGGNDIIVGGVGSDTLVGNEGRDVLFDGGGADTLQAGEGEDFVFSGSARDARKFNVSFVYDTDPAAMRAISDEWTRSDLGYADRIDHLTGKTAGGLNGRIVLSDENTSDDFSRDVLNGEGGRDAFFYSSHPQATTIRDVLKDREKNERAIVNT